MKSLSGPTPQGDGDEGGHSGGGCPPSRPPMRTADVKLFNRAIRGRWPMSEETRARVIETLDHIVANPDRFDVRTVIAASKTLMEADRINLKDEDRTTKAPIMIEDNGTQRVDFSHMTDAEIDAYIARTRPRI